MKKLSILLAVCICAGALFSCNRTNDDKSDDEQTDIISTDIGKDDKDQTKPAPENTYVTREQISSAVDELYKSELNADGSAPEYMDLKFVKGLTAEDYGDCKPRFTLYCNNVSHKLESLAAGLPEKCTMTHRAEFGQNYTRETVKYVILDSSAVSDNTDELLLFLEYNFYKVKYGDGISKYYDADMDALAERYSNVGDVLIEFSGEWYFFDTKTLELEAIEPCPDYAEIKDIYGDLTAEYINEAESTAV